MQAKRQEFLRQQQIKEVRRILKCRRTTEDSMTWFNPLLVLKITETILEDEITAKYHTLARLIHPDKCRDIDPGLTSVEAFAIVSLAYKLIKSHLNDFIAAETRAHESTMTDKKCRKSLLQDIMDAKMDDNIMKLFFYLTSMPATEPQDNTQVNISALPQDQPDYSDDSATQVKISSLLQDQPDYSGDLSIISTNVSRNNMEIIPISEPIDVEPILINKVAARGAEHTKNKMPHKKDRHEKGIRQRNRQKALAEKRLLEQDFAFTGKVHITNHSIHGMINNVMNIDLISSAHINILH